MLLKKYEKRTTFGLNNYCQIYIFDIQDILDILQG